MNRRIRAAYTGLAFGALLASDAAGEVLFDCALGNKQLSVTLEGGTATYTFGPKGAPEMTITAAPRDLNYVPWNGIGRFMPEAVEFENQGTIYQLWYGLEKLIDENAPLPPIRGGVWVMKGDEVLADLVCDSPPSVYALEAIYDAKLAAGQCYDWESQSWGTRCTDQPKVSP